MLGGRTHDELMAEFIAAHQNRWNRAFHFVGIPMIVSSAALWAAALFDPELTATAAGLTLTGLGCQFVGHAIEGNRPEVFRDWRFIVIGLEWWWMLLRGRV